MEAPAGGVDDMTKLSYLHEPGVLQNLKIRYELNEIYVCISYINSVVGPSTVFCLGYNLLLFMTDIHRKHPYCD